MSNCPNIGENEICEEVTDLNDKISEESAEWAKGLLTNGAKAIMLYRDGAELKACFYYED